jgi:hypothetical protein
MLIAPITFIRIKGYFIAIQTPSAKGAGLLTLSAARTRMDKVKEPA